MTIRAKQQPDQDPVVDYDAPESNDPRDIPQTYGHKHPAAFSVVLYKGVETGTLEEIWNAWDGPPPLYIELRATGERADCTMMAVYAPEYMPEVGERIGVPLTEARARIACREGMDKLICKGGPLLEAAQSTYASEAEAIDDMTRELLERQLGDDLIVTSGYLEALRDARAQGLISHHAPAAPTAPRRRSAVAVGKLRRPANDVTIDPALLDALDARMAACGAPRARETFIALPPLGRVTDAFCGTTTPAGAAVMWSRIEGPHIETGAPAAAVMLTAMGSSRVYPVQPGAATDAAFAAGVDTLRAHGIAEQDVPKLTEKLNTITGTTLEVLRERVAEAVSGEGLPNTGSLAERLQARLKLLGFIEPGTDPNTAERCASHAIIDPRDVSVGNIVVTALVHDADTGYEILASPGQAWALGLRMRRGISRDACLKVYEMMIPKLAAVLGANAVPTGPDGKPIRNQTPKAKA